MNAEDELIINPLIKATIGGGIFVSNLLMLTASHNL
jgi:hypothetical protein